MPACLASKLARHQPLVAPLLATPHRAGRDTCLAPWWWMPAALVDATTIPRPSAGALPVAARAGTTKLWSFATIIAARQQHKPAAGAAGNTDALAHAAAVKVAVNKAAVWRAKPANVDARPHRHELPAGLIDITCGTATAWWYAMSMGAKGAVVAAVAGSWGLGPAAVTLHPEAAAPLLLPWHSPLLAHVCASGCGDVRRSIGTVSQADARCSSAAIAGGRELLCGSNNACSTGLRLQPVHSKGAAASGCAGVTSVTVVPVGVGRQANLAARSATQDQSGSVESMHRVTAHGCGRNMQPGLGRPVCAGSCCRADTAAALGRAAAHVLWHWQSVLTHCGVVLVVLKASPAVWRWFSVSGGLASLLLWAAACRVRQAFASPAAAKALAAALVDAAVACVVPQPAHRMRLVGLRPSVLHGNSSSSSAIAASWLPSAPASCRRAARAGWLTCRRHLWWHLVNLQVHRSACC